MSPTKNGKKRKKKISDRRQPKKAKIESDHITGHEAFQPEKHQFSRNREEPSIGIISDSADSPEKSKGIENNPILSNSILSDALGDSQFKNDSKQSTVASGIRGGAMIMGKFAKLNIYYYATCTTVTHSSQVLMIQMVSWCFL